MLCENILAFREGRKVSLKAQEVWVTAGWHKDTGPALLWSQASRQAGGLSSCTALAVLTQRVTRNKVHLQQSWGALIFICPKLWESKEAFEPPSPSLKQLWQPTESKELL